MDWKEVLTNVQSTLDIELFRIGGTQITPSTLLIVLLIVIVTFRGSRAIRRAVEKRLLRRGGGDGSVGAITALLHYVVVAVGLSVAAQTAGIDLTALMAAGAVFAVGIGLAMQNVAQNFVSGIILLVERSIRPGDVIEVEGRVVKIVRMGIRATMVKTRDNEEIILPNSTLSQSAVTNYTLDELACRVRLKVGVSYASDMSVVREALLESARALPDAIADREPEVLMADFGDHAVVFDLGVWISDPWRMRSIRAALAAVIWDTFADRGVTIAFQQLDLHLDPPVVDTLRALSGRAA